MTQQEKILAVLDTPKTPAQIMRETGICQRTVAHAIVVLGKKGCVRCAGIKNLNGGGRRKLWVATGKPWAGATYVRYSAPRKRTGVHVRREGSGVIAPRPYAYGYLWSNR